MTSSPPEQLFDPDAELENGDMMVVEEDDEDEDQGRAGAGGSDHLGEEGIGRKLDVHGVLKGSRRVNGSAVPLDGRKAPNLRACTPECTKKRVQVGGVVGRGWVTSAKSLVTGEPTGKFDFVLPTSQPLTPAPDPKMPFGNEQGGGARAPDDKMFSSRYPYLPGNSGYTEEMSPLESGDASAYSQRSGESTL